MELEVFHHELLSLVRSQAEATQDFLRRSFVREAATRLADAEEIADFEPCHFEGAGPRGRRLLLDGYAFDDIDGSVSLIAAEFFNSDDIEAFGAADCRRTFSALKAFVEEALTGDLTNQGIDESHPAYGFASDLRLRAGEIRKFRLYLVSDGRLSTRLSEWPGEALAAIDAEFHIWDIERFRRAHESASGREAIEVSFEIGNQRGLPYLSAGVSGDEYQAFMCVIPGTMLASLYQRHGSRLLEGNVRSFLTTKGKVNAGIQITLRERPDLFFAYNNGIATTAEAVRFSADQRLILSATNLQIVNGGQTTASLALAAREGIDLDKVAVQMKLSVLKPAAAGELIPLIARYANSQNKVSDADFFANHPFHIRLEEISRRVWTPAPPGTQHGTHWFYERARGQYLNEQSALTRAQKIQYQLVNPRSQVLTKTDIAKLENTWRGSPHKVSLGAQKNFIHFADWLSKAWIEEDKQFNDAYFRYLVSLAIVFKHTEALVSKQRWYQGGYRANVVTYSMAKLHHMVLKSARGAQLDLDAVWSKQEVSAALNKQLEMIAYAVFKVLTDPARPKENVTEWAKMQACWNRVQEVEIELDHGLVTRPPDLALQRAVADQTGGTQPAGYGLFAKAAVMNIDADEWERTRSWAAARGLLDDRDAALLRLATRIPKFVPSAKECERILRIRSRIIADGYDGHV